MHPCHRRCLTFVYQTVDEVVKEHLKASKRLRKAIEHSPKKAKELLILAGILDKNGTRLARRYRRGS